MKSMLLKDFYSLRAFRKALLVLLVFYTVWAFLMEGGTGMLAMLIVMSAALTINLFAYDEASKWDNYALTMPVTRREIVAARYVASTAMLLACTAFCMAEMLVLQLVKPAEVQEESWVALWGAFFAGLLLIAVLLPLCYKWGVEKSRIAILILCFLPVGAMILIAKSGVPLPDTSAMEALGASLIPIFTGGMLLLLAVSYVISARIYSNKEF